MLALQGSGSSVPPCRLVKAWLTITAMSQACVVSSPLQGDFEYYGDGTPMTARGWATYLFEREHYFHFEFQC